MRIRTGIGSAAPHPRVPSRCSKFSAENPQVLHILGQQFSTKEQSEKIRMAAAAHNHEVATAEPILTELLYPA
jgi:hypothetical protein